MSKLNLCSDDSGQVVIFHQRAPAPEFMRGPLCRWETFVTGRRVSYITCLELFFFLHPTLWDISEMDDNKHGSQFCGSGDCVVLSKELDNSFMKNHQKLPFNPADCTASENISSLKRRTEFKLIRSTSSKFVSVTLPVCHWL